MANCASCGQGNPDGFQFCGHCGASMAEAAGPREVRKTVTVLFCDVTGSTALGERVDPEPLRRLMGRYFDEMRRIVERHGGTVEKFIGDAVMAVFGVPQAHEDDALRAVRAAAEMQAAAGPLDLQLRIGVNTGEVVTGEGEGLVTGDAVNVAARLEQSAAPGETVIGTGTLRLVRGAVTVEPSRGLELKGKAKPVEAHRLIAVDPDAPSHPRRLDAPMIGRRRELERLVGDFEQSRADRACHLFTLLGAAGVGKSRLVGAFLDSVSDQARVLRGRCLHYGEGITYWAVVEVLIQLGGDPESVIGGSPPETQLAFRKLLESEAAKQPLVVHFDDLQWAEPTFLELIEHVAEWSRDAPIFLLCTARPELLDIRPMWGGGKLNATSLLLESLSPDESATLVDNLLAGLELDDSARARIIDAAEGNPLFVEEMIAMVREDGSEGELVVPPTIHALLQARLDRLTTSERSVIERGAVEGQVFHRGAVQELSTDAVDVGANLLTLVRKELIRPERATLADDDAFRFRHLLIRDAAYESLPKETRAALHERFAVWLDSHGELLEQDEIVGYHLEQAARYRAEIGTEDEGLAERAATRLVAAARGALARGDFRAATSLLRRGTMLLPVGHPRRLDALPDYFYALISSGGGWEEADAAVEELQGADDERARTYGAMFAPELAFISARRQESAGPPEVAAAAARDTFARLGDDKGLAHAMRNLAYGSWVACRGEEAVEAFEAAAHHARLVNLRHLEDECLSRVAAALSFGPIPATEAIARLESLDREFGGRLTVSAAVKGALARVLAGRGELDLAQRLAKERERMDAEAGLDVAAAGTGSTLAWIAWCVGDPADEERVIREWFTGLEALGERGYLSTAAMHLGKCLADQGRDEEARDWLERSRKLTNPTDVVNHVGLDSLEAVLLARSGDIADAERLVRQALAAADETDFTRVRAPTRRDAAEVFERAGKIEEARDALEEAVILERDRGELIPEQRFQEELATFESRHR